MSNECIDTEHSLIEVLRSHDIWGDFSIAMWCTKCGSIVIDFETAEGCRSPGLIEEMRAPGFSKQDSEA